MEYSQALTLNMMGNDDGDGEIFLDARGRVRFVAPHDSSMAKKISACRKIALRLRAPLFVSRFRSTSVHLLGGCNAAMDCKGGVADPNGQVFDPVPKNSNDQVHPGLYVCDGSLIPCSVGVNPSSTITTVAEFVAEAIVRNAEGNGRISSFADQNINKPLSLMGSCGGDSKYASGKNPASQVRPKPTQKEAGVIVRETLRGSIGGFPTVLQAVMHLGTETTDDAKRSRGFGEPNWLLKGRVGGSMRVLQLNADILHILDGTVDMCVVDPRTPYAHYMHYRLHLISSTGVRYLLEGEKAMRQYMWGLWAWEESTTLKVKLQQLSEAKENTNPVLHGILRVSLLGVLKSAMSLKGPRKLDFATLLLQSIIRTYFWTGPRTCMTFSSGTSSRFGKRESLPLLPLSDSYPAHILHELTTEDGWKISVRQWPCTASPNGAPVSNVVLLLNGHSTENYWLPTESSDLVRFLLENGYEPWLLNSRLDPLHVCDRTFNLDDIAKYDVPMAFRKIEEVRGEILPIQVVAHCVGGLNIHMAVMGGYVPVSKVASILCTNSSMFFRVNTMGMAKLMAPLLPISMLILGKNTAFRTYNNREDGFRHQLLRFIAKNVPRLESCTCETCYVFAGVFGNSVHHCKVSPSAHENYAPHIFPMSAMPHVRKIILRGHLVDATGKNVYMPHPERIALPTTYISGGTEVLITQKTGQLAHEFMKQHHPQFVHDRVVVPDFGHSDMLVGGEDSRKIVFPHILKHLERVKHGQHMQSNEFRQAPEWEKHRVMSTWGILHPLFLAVLALAVATAMCYLLLR